MMKLNKTIALRKIDIKDVDALYSIKNNNEAISMLGGFSNGYSLDDIKRWIEFHANKTDEVLLGIEDITKSKVIGHVGLYNIDYRVRKAEFGILIGDTNYHNKGIGKLVTNYLIQYGFNQLNLNKIVLSVLQINKPAISLYEKLGFVEQGVLKDEQFKDGKYIDVLLMAKFNE